jgi:hypothetical protein
MTVSEEEAARARPATVPPFAPADFGERVSVTELRRGLGRPPNDHRRTPSCQLTDRPFCLDQNSRSLLLLNDNPLPRNSIRRPPSRRLLLGRPGPPRSTHLSSRSSSRPSMSLPSRTTSARILARSRQAQRPRRSGMITACSGSLASTMRKPSGAYSRRSCMAQPARWPSEDCRTRTEPTTTNPSSSGLRWSCPACSQPAFARLSSPPSMPLIRSSMSSLRPSSSATLVRPALCLQPDASALLL